MARIQPFGALRFSFEKLMAPYRFQKVRICFTVVQNVIIAKIGRGGRLECQTGVQV